MKTLWKLISHHIDKDAAVAWTKQNKRIAVGWGFTGDVVQERHRDPKEIFEIIDLAFKMGEHPSNNASDGGFSLWSLAHEMEIGDHVLISGSRPRELVVEVVGEYQWLSQQDPILGDYRHQREVRITGLSPDKLWSLAGAKTIAGRNPRGTLVRCAHQISPGDL